MKISSRSHADYCHFVATALQSLSESSELFCTIQKSLEKVIQWITAVDLSGTAQLLSSTYSANSKGRTPRDPADLLRSFLLMTREKISIDRWVMLLRTSPVHAILSGFHPHNVPGVGSFYDFIRRLWVTPSPHRTLCSKRPLGSRRKRGKKNEKLQPKRPGIVEKLVARINRSKSTVSFAQPFDRLQQLFQNLFVLPSAEKQLLGDPMNLSVCGDGSPVYSGARKSGKSICTCRQQRIFTCTCDRQFSDPDADLGWDSFRETNYFGRTLYVLSASESKHNLPVYLRLWRASQHDSVSFVCTYQEFIRQYSDWNVSEVILDSAHDASPIYSMLNRDHVHPIIDLNHRKKGCFTYKEMAIDPDGTPICPIGRKMIYWGKEKSRNRTKWRCPAALGKWECTTPCSTSAYGRTFHTNSDDNPRLFTSICRSSDKWKERYRLRTGVERCIKRQKVDYELESSKGRSSRHWNTRVYMIAMCQHLDAWSQDTNSTKSPFDVTSWVQNHLTI